jgi:hypothetical protein
MTEEEAFAAYAIHPDTNRAAFDALFSETMADIEYAAMMKVQKVLWSETDERS